MSSENEGGQPPYGDLGAEPTAQFDAFRARRADELEQQAGEETQTAYVFPAEYAADPGAALPPPPAPGPFTPLGTESGGRREGAGNRWRSLAIFGGAVVVAAALGLGAWAAFGSSGPSASASSSGATPAGTATTGKDAGKHTKALTFRVTIESVGADSFTGKALADGKTVTVTLTDKTHFGTKAHPFSRSSLTPGETVIVRGKRTGTDTITATVVAANVDATSSASASAGAGAGAGAA